MAPTVRLKGPRRGNNNVSIYSVIVTSASLRANKVKSPKKVNVTIRLPREILKRIHEESELTSMDKTLNEVLTEKTMNVTLKYSPKKESLGLLSGSDISDYKPKVESDMYSSETNTQVTKDTQEPLPAILRDLGYRNIPSNLIFLLKREFGFLNETEEEIEMIDKMVFTLTDPLTAKKIKLPIKSIGCTHFECFDFDNFCVFNHLPYGVRYALKKDLIKKSTDLKKKHKYFADDSAPMNAVVKEFKYQPNYPNVNFYRGPGGNNSQHHFPTYKCPVCNKGFLLNQLFISDILNYFIKTTPMDIYRIELRDMMKYRIVDEKEMVKEVPKEDVVVLSDEDSDENDDNKNSAQPDRKTHHNSHDTNDNANLWGSSLNDPYDSDDAFGSDDSFLLSYNNYQRQTQNSNSSSTQLKRSTQVDSYTGSGSWEDPVTLD